MRNTRTPGGRERADVDVDADADGFGKVLPSTWPEPANSYLPRYLYLNTQIDRRDPTNQRNDDPETINQTKSKTQLHRTETSIS